MSKFNLILNPIKYGLKHKVILHPHSEMFQQIYEQFSDFLPKATDFVLDIGAQYGDYAIVCNRLYGAKVAAFEPLKDNYVVMNRLARINRAHIETFNVALSDHDGFLSMYSDGGMLRSEEYSNRKERIRFTTLDSYEFKPNLVKIDVEGFEMQVLKGSIKTIEAHHPKIIIETHSSSLEEEVCQFFSKMNYELKHEFDRRPGNNWTDELVNLFFA